jgi:hypothetical protein
LPEDGRRRIGDPVGRGLWQMPRRPRKSLLDDRPPRYRCRAMRIPIGHFVIVVLLASCASAEKDQNGGKPKPAREVVSGGATVRGGGIRMDVQVGRPFVQKPTRSIDATAKPGAVVAP